MHPHCHHCCWGHEHHPDDAPGHDTAFSSGCATGAKPIEQEALW